MSLSILFNDPTLFIVWLIAIIYALTVHEFSHALAAYLFGDTTPEAEGRLTLNPLAHIDPMGMVLLVLVGFGWGKPVHFNPNQIKSRRWGEVVIGLAGPLANFLSVLVFYELLKYFSYIDDPNNLMLLLFTFIMWINANLMIFNLLPIPPLDGSHFLVLLPESLNWLKFRLMTQGPVILLGLVIIDSLFGGIIFNGIFIWARHLLFNF